MSKYHLTNKKDATCGVSFETLEDGFINVKYDINGVNLWETNWENLGKMLQTLEGWEDRVMYVVNIAEGKNWEISIGRVHYTDDEVFLRCYGNDGPVIDLGKLAECYDDCDNCDRYCYSFKNDSPFENKSDCPNYSRCAECYGTIYDEFGEEEDFDTLWDFRCYCTKLNGRQKIKEILGGE